MSTSIENPHEMWIALIVSDRHCHDGDSQRSIMTLQVMFHGEEFPLKLVSKVNVLLSFSSRLCSGHMKDVWQSQKYSVYYNRNHATQWKMMENEKRKKKSLIITAYAHIAQHDPLHESLMQYLSSDTRDALISQWAKHSKYWFQMYGEKQH